MKLPAKRNIYVSIFYLLFILSLLYRFSRSIIHGYAKECWQITEFLINYQGGFVRRGLLGEILLTLYNCFGLKPYTAIIFLCILSYLILVLFFTKSFIKNGYPIFILPFVFFLGGPIINNFWVRKDVLVILIFILIIYFTTQKTNKYIIFIFINLLFIIGLLIHEAIAFFCFPVLLLILIDKNNSPSNYKNSTKSIFISLIQLLPSFFTFFCVLYYKGSLDISNTVWESWKQIPFPFYNEDSSQIPAAIKGLSWSLKKGLSFSFKTLRNFKDGIYAPIAWFIILLLIYFVLTNTDKLNIRLFKYKPVNNFHKSIFSNILVFQFLSVIPLFILGWDYGRWVFLWVASSFALIILIPDKNLSILFPKCIGIISSNLNDILDSTFSKSKELIFLLCLLIGFPTFSWNLSRCIDTISLVIVSKFILRFPHELLEFIKTTVL